MGVTLTLRFEGGSQAPSAARRALEPLEPHVDGPMLEELRLLVSELVTNSIRHGGAGATGYIGLDVWISSRVVRVEVSDSGSGFDPGRPDPDWRRAGGWGLYLLDQMADRWGVRREEGSRVWFEIDQSPVTRDASATREIPSGRR